MERNNTINELSPIIFNPDNIPRCPNCNLISSLKLLYLNNQPIINYKCEEGHEGNLLLKEYLNIYNTNSLLKEKCGECGKNQKEIKGDFVFCNKCSKFLCNLCQLNHSNYNGHDIINIQRYDSLCKIHSNSYCFYCINCQKNICVYCQLEHKSHELINLFEFNYTKESQNKLKETIKTIEIKIKNLDIIKSNIIDLINKTKESSEFEIKYMKLLLYSYEYEEEQHNLNYYLIQNIDNFLKSNKIKTYENINEEGNKFIYILQNSLNKTNVNPRKSNFLQNNFKVLKNHKNCIYHLSELKDGRLASCSEDKTFNIYQKDTFKLDLSIKEHINYISSFTQLHDERIITCSGDKTMKIIKLIEEKKYKIEQILTGHKDGVMKVIEIKENELLSVSYDNTMKIWKLNIQNIFESSLTIPFQNSWSECNILKLNINEFALSSHKNNFVQFWNSNVYCNIATINNIESSWTWRNMCLLEDDILCVGGVNLKGFYLIKISTHQHFKNIIGPITVWSIIKCLDGLFLCSIQDENGEHSIVKYKYENQNFKKIVEKVRAHNNDIYSCIELHDGIIASAGKNYSIKLWSDD